MKKQHVFKIDGALVLAETVGEAIETWQRSKWASRYDEIGGSRRALECRERDIKDNTPYKVTHLGVVLTRPEADEYHNHVLTRMVETVVMQEAP